MSIVRRVKSHLVRTNGICFSITHTARAVPEWGRVELGGAYLETINAGPYLGAGPTQYTRFPVTTDRPGLVAPACS